MIWPAAEFARPGEPNQAAPPVVAAYVGNRPIYVHEVEHELARATAAKGFEAGAKAYWQAKTLQQRVDREIVLRWLQDTSQAASATDVNVTVDRLQRNLVVRKQSLQEYARQRGLDEQALRHSLLWQISWERFLNRHLTDENLEKYFSAHRREFDGTQLRVAHIFLPFEPSAGQRQDSVVAEMKRLKKEVVAGTATFAEAASRHSKAPTANVGGDIGFISRHEPMPEAFSRAAFALGVGEVSDPVATAVGVHLIRCLEEKAGQQTWRQVRPALGEAMTQYLFDWAANRGRPQVEVRFTGAMPHFLPGTEELAGDRTQAKEAQSP